LISQANNWLVVSTPLKNMRVSWGYYSQYMENHKTHFPNHQPELLITNQQLGTTLMAMIVSLKSGPIEQWSV